MRGADKVREIMHKSKVLTVRNFSKYVSEEAVIIEGHNPDEFGFLDFETMELLLLLITASSKNIEEDFLPVDIDIENIPERYRDKLSLSLNFTVYDLLSLRGGSLGKKQYEEITEQIEKLKQFKKISIVSKNEVITYEFPIASAIRTYKQTFRNGKERIEYKVILSPITSILLFADRRIKSTVREEIIQNYFRLPPTLRKLVLYLLNYIQMTMKIDTAMKIAGIDKSNKTRFIKNLDKHSKDLLYFGIVYKPSEGIIDYKHTKTVIDFSEEQSISLHTLLEKLFSK